MTNEERDLDYLRLQLAAGTISRGRFMRLATLAAGAAVAGSILRAHDTASAEEALTFTRAGLDAASLVDTSRYKKPPPWTIAHASQGPTNSWALTLDESVNYGTQYKYKGKFNKVLYADANGAISKQLSDIEDLVVQNPDLLIVTILGLADLAPIGRAMDKGIPVIIQAGDVTSGKWVTNVNRSNRLNGTLTAQWLAKYVHGTSKYVSLSGIAGTPTANDRYAGAQSVFKKYPGMVELTHQYTDWSVSKGKTVAEGLLTSHPDLQSVWSDSAFQDMGLIDAYVQAGKSMPPMTAEPLNGFLRRASAHNVKFYAVGFPPTMSLTSVDIAVKILSGQPVPRYVQVPALTFDYTQVNKYYKPQFSDDLWVDNLLPDWYLAKIGFTAKKK
jgi:ribose transport system substrate-binding protein